MSAVVITDPNAPSSAEIAVANERARAEYDYFETVRPRLMVDPTLLGRWVVMLDHEVKFVSKDFTEAHHWALDNLGVVSGFILGEVAEPRVVYIGPPRAHRQHNRHF